MDVHAAAQKLGLGVGRRTLGICLLMIVVVLWTASSFLASVRYFKTIWFNIVLLFTFLLPYRCEYANYNVLV